jgi:hypothetical protein
MASVFSAMWWNRPRQRNSDPDWLVVGDVAGVAINSFANCRLSD